MILPICLYEYQYTYIVAMKVKSDCGSIEGEDW